MEWLTAIECFDYSPPAPRDQNPPEIGPWASLGDRNASINCLAAAALFRCSLPARHDQEPPEIDLWACLGQATATTGWLTAIALLVIVWWISE